MTADLGELERRQAAARAAIAQAVGAQEYDGCVDLFISHHLDEISAQFWRARLGVDRPAPEDVVGLLTLKAQWSDEEHDEAEKFDFTLPDGATDYVLCVRFDSDGDVSEIAMES